MNLELCGHAIIVIPAPKIDFTTLENSSCSACAHSKEINKVYL